MKPTPFHVPFLHFRLHSPALGLVVASLAIHSAQAATWVGDTSQDWNTAANWDSDPANPTGAFTINTATAGVFPIISASSAFNPTDIIVGTGATGRVDQTSGTVLTGAGAWLRIGQDVGTGTYNQTAGILNAGAIHMISTGTSGTATLNIGGTVNTTGETVVFDGSNAGVTGLGTLNANSGGTLNSEGDLLIAFAGSGAGEVNVAAGATVNVATTTKRWLIMSVWDTVQGRLNVNGGTVNLNANTDIQFSTGGWGPGASQGPSSITLNSGAITSWGGNQTGTGGGVLNLDNNGTSAGLSNTVNLNGGTLTIAAIISGQTVGSRVFNFNGGTLKPTAANANFFVSGAASTANVRNGGAIIDSNGVDITIGQAFVHSTIGGDNAIDGGLTKNGEGTLTLSGLDNSYTGATTVNAGRLALSGLPATSGLTVAADAGLEVEEPGNPTGSLTIPSLSFGAGATLTLETNTGDASEKVVVSNAGGLSFSTLGVNLNITDTTNGAFGGTYTLLEYTGSFTGNIADIEVLNPRDGYTYNFANTGSAITVEVIAGDTDGDGMDDIYEQNNGLDYLVNDADGNLDGDFATNIEEFIAGTDPQNPAEDPRDTDLDGLRDTWEDQYFGDNDGIIEPGDLTQNGLGDPDGDLANDLAEFVSSTIPTNGSSWPDTDLTPDQMNDAWENHFFGDLDAKDGSEDTDGDGYTDLQEHDAHTDPTLARVSPIWAELKHRWSFNGNLNDSVGGSNATIVEVGVNDVIQGPASVQLTGGAKADSDYVKLGENLLPKSTTPVTIELWAKQDTIRNWGRIFDFNSGNGEALMMAWNMNGNNAADRLEFVDSGILLQIDNANQPYGTTDEHHIVVTLEPLAGTDGKTRVSIYSAVSGAADLGPAKAVAETAVNLVNFNDALDALGYSPWPDDTASATYNEVRIWNGALFGWMREKLHDQGADNAAIPDVDNDFLPDAWEIQYFTNTTTATTLSGDNDGDAVTNLDEYLAGTDPNDGDGDEMNDAWENTHFGNTAQTAGGDFDNDGTANITEYRLGLTPTSGSSRFFVTGGTSGVLTWPSAEGLTFTVQRSINLSVWEDLDTVAGTAGTATYTDATPPPGTAFYRILLEP